MLVQSFHELIDVLLSTNETSTKGMLSCLMRFTVRSVSVTKPSTESLDMRDTLTSWKVHRCIANRTSSTVPGSIRQEDRWAERAQALFGLDHWGAVELGWPLLVLVVRGPQTPVVVEWVQSVRAVVRVQGQPCRTSSLQSPHRSDLRVLLRIRGRACDAQDHRVETEGNRSKGDNEE